MLLIKYNKRSKNYTNTRYTHI